MLLPSGKELESPQRCHARSSPLCSALMRLTSYSKCELYSELQGISDRDSFFDRYHPFLPFLNPAKSPDEYFTDSSILFWAIIGVASRRYSENIMLFAVLSEWVPKLIWSMVSSPPYTIEAAQAIILLIAWPFPSSSLWNDTLPTLSAISISICMQLGLHRPMNATDFQSEQDLVAPPCERLF
jgi:hypothetical protein